MPHRLAFLTSVNRLLDWQDEELTEATLQVLVNAPDLEGAAERAGLFDPGQRFDPALAREAVVALPPSLSAGLLATVISALERRLAVVVQWKQASGFELQLWESVDDEVGAVGVLVLSPRGQDMVPGAGTA
ncbi:MAG TPA: hypothetical protein VMN58_05785 [Acidimicrobiales bacterium]|nr:hypothetical protein [Acidimicrobiales bacterium]